MYSIVYIPHFRLVAARRLLPRAEGAAVLVESLGRQSKVIEADGAALAAGVEPGMTAPRALARCPGLNVIAASMAAEALAEQTLLHAAFDIAPRVERVSPGCFLIDLQGRKRAEIAPAAEAALAALHRQDLPARMGIAPTPGLAGFAARSTGFLQAVKHVTAFLDATALDAAAPSAELAGILTHWGLKTLGEFARLTRESLAHRFGPEALTLWDACHGRDSRPLDAIELPPGYGEHLELDHAIETLEPLLFIIRRFIDSLCMRLEQQHCSATRIVLALHLDDRTDHTFDCKLPEPTQQAGTLFRTIQAHLEQVKTEAPVVALSLELLAERALVRQRGLFETAMRDPVRFADTLDRLSGIVGGDNVGSPRLEDTHLPDSIRMERLPQSISPHTPASECQRGRGLPLRRCRLPLPAQVRMESGAPAYVHAGRIEGRVLESAGPFFTSGHWWEGTQAWQREEWDVELPESRLLRLLRRDGNWFLEGRYE